MKKIGVIGLGYVGLPVALAFGQKYQTIGFDTDTNRILELRENYDSTLEFSADELSGATNVDFTGNIIDLRDCNIFIVTVPTPVDKFNVPDLSALRKATNMVAQILKKNDIVVYESTVFPGATEEVCVPILEAVSNLVYNRDFFCGYSPERINPGDPENKFRDIVKITSGSTTEVAAIINDLYSSVVDAGTFSAASIKVAEAAKVIENVQRDINIAFVNELSLIFEKLDIDTYDVLDAAGTKWNFLPFRPGLVGGHCIGVDPFYLTHKAAEFGYHCEIISAGRRLNDAMPRRTAEKIAKRLSQNIGGCHNAKVGVLGITFKENCPDIRNSKTFELIQELSDWGMKIVVSDPYHDESISKFGFEKLNFNDLHSLDVLVVTIGHKEYREMHPSQLLQLLKKRPGVLIADLKGLYSKDAFTSVDVIRL